MTTTSSPPNTSLCKRKDSRTTLFRRFRWTAKRQFFFEIARPSLPAFLPFARDRTVNSVSRLRFDFSNTRWKEPASSSRASLENRRLEMSSCFGLFSVVTEIAAQRLSSIVHHAPDNLRRQLRTPFRAPAIQDLPPALCCHARSKAVCACPLDSAGLERAFHLPQSWTCSNHKMAAQKEGRLCQ
jgi:hypothetical protein